MGNYKSMTFTLERKIIGEFINWEKPNETRKLRYYSTFNVRKLGSLLCKINTCFQKTTTCTVLQAKQIFSVKI